MKIPYRTGLAECLWGIFTGDDHALDMKIEIFSIIGHFFLYAFLSALATLSSPGFLSRSIMMFMAESQIPAVLTTPMK